MGHFSCEIKFREPLECGIESSNRHVTIYSQEQCVRVSRIRDFDQI